MAQSPRAPRFSAVRAAAAIAVAAAAAAASAAPALGLPVAADDEKGDGGFDQRRFTGPRVNTEPEDPLDVRVVHLVQSNHLDLGFSDFASNVINRYFTGEEGTAAPPENRSKRVYYPSFFLGAANTSRILRAKSGGRSGEPGFVYLVHPWLVELWDTCDAASLPPAVKLADPLRCPTQAQRREFAEALARGDAVVHAFPHSAQPEVLSADGFDAGLALAASVAARHGRDPPAVLSQRDVPGLTRGAVPRMARRGIVGVSVGANDGSPPPEVPSTVDCYRGYRQIRTPFVWRDAASNTSVVVDVHPGGYGGEIPLLDPNGTAPSSGPSTYSRDGLLCDCVGVRGLGEVLCYAFRGDNYGPASVEETEQNWRVFSRAFPNATVRASTLDAFFKLLDAPEVRGRLPVVESEIGDTWVYGVASDPGKTAMMRAAMRARGRCVAAGRCGPGDEPGMARFTHLLLKTAEHTWGGSYAGHMQVYPPSNWSNAALNEGRAAGTDPFYAVAEASWEEQRRFVPFATDALGGASALAREIRAEFATIAAAPPDPATAAAKGYTAVPAAGWAGPFALGGGGSGGGSNSFKLGPVVALDLASGALTRLDRGGVAWASPSQPLFRFAYKTHSYEDKCEYAKTYEYAHGGEHPYSPGAFTPPSPGLNGSGVVLATRQFYAAVSGVWARQSSSSVGGGAAGTGTSAGSAGRSGPGGGRAAAPLMSADSLLVRLDGRGMGPGCYSRLGDVWVNYTWSAGSDELTAELVWAAKTPTRLPESAWLEVRPRLPEASGAPSSASSWTLTVDKLGTAVDTADVVVNGGSTLHALSPEGSIAWRRRQEEEQQQPGAAAAGSASALVVRSLDAALVAPGGVMDVWNWTAYNEAPPDPRDGAAFNLFNNLYSTNYVLYFPWNSTRDSVSRFRFALSFE